MFNVTPVFRLKLYALCTNHCTLDLGKPYCFHSLTLGYLSLPQSAVIGLSGFVVIWLTSQSNDVGITLAEV